MTHEDIARGLSEAMRNGLLHNRVASDGSRWLNFSTTPKTGKALARRGLVDGCLTTLGLAVRAIMERDNV